MASRFWVGGTGTWTSSDTTKWSASSGGASGASVPGSADTAVFDGGSGAAVVTVDSTINGATLQGITFTGTGGFAGTLDFSVNNPSLTMQTFSITGSGTRTLKLGSGTFTLTSGSGTSAVWDATTTTGLTFTAGTATIYINQQTGFATHAFVGGGLAYGTLQFANNAGLTQNLPLNITGNNTFASLNFTSGSVWFPQGGTQTVSGAFTINGSSSSPVLFTVNGAGGTSTISVASGTVTCNWCAFSGMTFSGGATFTANNSFDLKGNTGITINAPSVGGGGGGVVIGS